MSARLIAFRVLSRVERDGAYSNIALMNELSERGDVRQDDRRLATELVYGSLRNRRLLDEWIDHLSNRPKRRTDPAVRHVLRLSLYQLIFLDRMPGHAVLSEAGKLLRRIDRRHAVSFVNAILRRFLREKKDRQLPEKIADPVRGLAIEYSIPDWLIKRWLDEPEFADIDPKRRIGKIRERVEKLNRPAPLTVAPNTTKTSREGLIEQVQHNGAHAKAGEWAKESVIVTDGGFSAVSPLVAEGYCHAVDESSQLVVELLDPQPGEKALDLCAAPGGKTLLIADKVGESGEVVAVDNSGPRLGLLGRQLERHDFSWVRSLCADVALPVDCLSKEGFDRVLVDAPCSALGVIRRHPEIRWRRSEQDLATLAVKAREIATLATHYLRPGGVLVFSVCTTTAEEGIEQLRHLVAMCGWQCERPNGIADDLWHDEGPLHWIDTSDIPNLDGFFCFRLRKPAV